MLINTLVYIAIYFTECAISVNTLALFVNSSKFLSAITFLSINLVLIPAALYPASKNSLKFSSAVPCGNTTDTPGTIAVSAGILLNNLILNILQEIFSPYQLPHGVPLKSR